ncbi:NAD(P)-binding protein [Polyplosphaeria fusca]|uniref:NAD(P)-binding protein n=1 Tax=Polyplosphaeria fusca TaxID=682080 RepID=A0A9P4V390_9PLEO|nr:NAD(P)-binding protein [Polyplosphaeria fusca]
MSTKIVFVTGANRGIGFAIVQALSTRFPNNTYLLGVRSLSNGQEAIKTLQSLGLASTFHAIEIDITSDSSIQTAISSISAQHPRVDVLVNNAAIAERTKPSEPGFRDSCNKTLNANVTSFFSITSAFLPLLHASPRPHIINISSARASMYKQTHAQLPPTASIPYNVSKTALNVGMLEMAKLEPGVLFQAASPGHCKTAFNGWTGKRDPLDGARVVVELVGDEGKEWGMGFWEFEEERMGRVEW